MDLDTWTALSGCAPAGSECALCVWVPPGGEEAETSVLCRVPCRAPRLGGFPGILCFICVQQHFELDGARGVDLLIAVGILNTFSDAAGLGQTSSRHPPHPESRLMSTWGLCFLCLRVRSWENCGLFQFACGPEEACTVINQ